MYKPLPDGITVKYSKIQGLGLYATKDFPKDTVFGIVHIKNKNFPHGHIRTALGAFYNHSDTPNCFKLKMYEDGSFWIGAKVDIEPGEELTWFYTLYNIKKEK